MRIYVCVKHVPDTAANIKIVGDAAYDTEVKYVANPYDEYGVEEAVSLVEKNKKGEVIAVCVGDKGAANTLKAVMAMGVHRSILIKTEDQFPGSDITAKALCKAITDDGGADLIFMGKQSVDGEGMQTPYRLAAEMGLPVATGIVAFSHGGETVNVQREIDGGAKELITIKTPCVLGAAKGLNEPRFPKLPAILKAKKKEIKEMDLADMGLTDQGQCRLKSLEPVQERSNAKILEGSTREIVASLVQILKEEEKVI
ncbi:electron transfer flavoprotein beta subunit [Desulfocicer vacuolatum DSM 3385]|uniref:Electron transfer flavoprotein subunit beta n=1 Tax=Desulfocicer vacuolatum DSM 3385 TaxID=1121400 RepID=A0A1W2DMH8_9BACT|nr:electron transfer flavoprotein subunit beta/FixA family protein [Desulfocicer vacuolatum]SMC98262.1 electron transfer flavoprotein beta subunit [Desulfocicer vacuolatum DSM 3385]